MHERTVKPNALSSGGIRRQSHRAMAAQRKLRCARHKDPSSCCTVVKVIQVLFSATDRTKNYSSNFHSMAPENLPDRENL
jgi:hypothetical protein